MWFMFAVLLCYHPHPKYAGTGPFPLCSIGHVVTLSILYTLHIYIFVWSFFLGLSLALFQTLHLFFNTVTTFKCTIATSWQPKYLKLVIIKAIINIFIVAMYQRTMWTHSDSVKDVAYSEPADNYLLNLQLCSPLMIFIACFISLFSFMLHNFIVWFTLSPLQKTIKSHCVFLLFVLFYIQYAQQKWWLWENKFRHMVNKTSWCYTFYTG